MAQMKTGTKVEQRLKTEKATGYPCPHCGKVSQVIDSRPSSNGWRRNRGCPNGHRFTTHEIVRGGINLKTDDQHKKSLLRQAQAILAAVQGDTAYHVPKDQIAASGLPEPSGGYLWGG